MANPQTFTRINGVDVDASSVIVPATGRMFRDAWQLNGDVIEIDMAKAKTIKIQKILAKAAERVAKAEAKALEKLLKGEGATAENAEAAKFKSKPKAAAVALIAGATTPDALDLITEDIIFS